MYGYIYIKNNTYITRLKTTDCDKIYDFLINKGYSHEEAEDIASWAEFADIDEEYETEQPDVIYIQW